jgi:putative GTP pyrophosphokinase
MLSKTQIDRLGDRLRGDTITEQDLVNLDEYRRSFGEAYEKVIRTISEQLQIETTGRAAKSTASIVEKLRRESIRLTQMQDIAGCRIIVPDLRDQDLAVASLQKVSPQTTIVDRREKPSYGYRAVHIIAKISGKLIEIQVRTTMQHLWAELSEKLSDVIAPEIKYGGGPDIPRNLLAGISESIATIENLTDNIAQVTAQTKDDKQQQKLKELQKSVLGIETGLANSCNKLLNTLKKKV